MNLLESIGNTPLVELVTLRNKFSSVRIFGKIEGVNPGGSVKDRTALHMINGAEKSGVLIPGKIILEPTSGNTGIAIAMIGAIKGYKVQLIMPESVSVERRNILKAFGASVDLTPAARGMDEAIDRAMAITAESPGRFFMPNQFNNKNNTLAHYKTTGPEIFAQTNGQVDMVVAGLGTTGTIMGVRRFMKSRKNSIKIVGVEPVVGHGIQGLKNMTESMKPEIYQPELLDSIVQVENDESFYWGRWLAQREGVFVGMSSGAALAGAVKAAETMKEGNIVVIFPDRGDRYLSTSLFCTA